MTQGVSEFDLTLNAQAARSENRETRLLLYFGGAFLVLVGLAIAFVIGPKPQFGPYQQLTLGLGLTMVGGLIIRQIAVNWNYPIRLRIDDRKVSVTYLSGRSVERAWSLPRLRIEIYDLRGTLAATREPSLTEIRAVFKPGPDVFLSPSAHQALVAEARRRHFSESPIYPSGPKRIDVPIGIRFTSAN
jgi:hypothetical protein